MKDHDTMAEQLRTIRWKKWALMGVAAFAALSGASYLVYASLGSGRLSPLALLALAAAVSIALPMIRSNFFPSERDRAAEYAFHEQRLARDVFERIHEALGPETSGQLFAGPDRFQDTAGDTLERLLADEEARTDPELRFAQLVALARFHEKEGDPRSAIPLIEAALDIQPDAFVVRMHLAGNYEWIGSQDEACQHYRWLRDHPPDLSTAMRRLVAAKCKTCPTD
jgi:hypothetical protein